jgi:hypothetical protein
MDSASRVHTQLRPQNRSRLESNFIMSPVSSDGIVTGHWMDERWSRNSSPSKVRYFLFSTSSRPVLGSTQPPIQWVQGAVPPGKKRLEREADHTPPTSADVNKMWKYTSTLPIIVAAPSEAWIVFAGSNTEIVGSNITQSMYICVRLFRVCNVLCVGGGLATCWSPSEESYRLCIKSRNCKSDQDQTTDYRDIIIIINPLPHTSLCCSA